MTIHIIAEPTPNSACNSPTTLSNSEIRSLELQRFLTLLKLHPIELHATFLRQAPPPPTGTAARPRHSPRTSEISRVKPLSPLLARLCVGLKPPSPLLAQAEPQLKPPSPLRAKRSCFSCIFRLQWCRRFQWSLFGGEQWCRRFHAGLHQWLQRRHWFQSWHVAVSCARKSSPSKPKTTEKHCFQARWANFFAEVSVEGPCWASFFAEMPVDGSRWANFFAPVVAKVVILTDFCRKEPFFEQE